MIPVPLRPLEKFEVILHFAFYERLDRDGALDPMFGESNFSTRVLATVNRYELG